MQSWKWLVNQRLREIYPMANTTAVLVSIAPADGDVVEIFMSGYVAREFVAMLNMNKICDSRGNRLVFSWERVGDNWHLAQTSYTPENQEAP